MDSPPSSKTRLSSSKPLVGGEEAPRTPTDAAFTSSSAHNHDSNNNYHNPMDAESPRSEQRDSTPAMAASNTRTAAASASNSDSGNNSNIPQHSLPLLPMLHDDHALLLPMLPNTTTDTTNRAGASPYRPTLRQRRPNHPGASSSRAATMTLDSHHHGQLPFFDAGSNFDGGNHEEEDDDDDDFDMEIAALLLPGYHPNNNNNNVREVSESSHMMRIAADTPEPPEMVRFGNQVPNALLMADAVQPAISCQDNHNHTNKGVVDDADHNKLKNSHANTCNSKPPLLKSVSDSQLLVSAAPVTKRLERTRNQLQLPHQPSSTSRARHPHPTKTTNTHHPKIVHLSRSRSNEESFFLPLLPYHQNQNLTPNLLSGDTLHVLASGTARRGKLPTV